MSIIVRLAAEYICILASNVYIMGTPLVHDICVRCIVCVLVVLSTTVKKYVFIFPSLAGGGWRRKLDIARWNGT